MKRIIKGNEKGVFNFTNHCINNLQLTKDFNKNHIAKVLMGHIEIYKTIINNLLENENR